MSKPIALIGYRSGLDLIIDIAKDLNLEIAGIYDKYFFGNTDKLCGLPVIGNEEQITEEEISKYDFVLASGYAGHNNPGNQEHNGDNLRKARIKIIKNKKLPLANLISPHAFVHESVQLGGSIVIARNCYIRANTVIGSFAYIDSGAAIAHDVIIGENCIMTPYSFIAGHITIGNNVMVGASSTIVNGYANKTMQIGNDVKIMAGSTVLKDVADGKFVHNSGKTLSRKDLTS